MRLTLISAYHACSHALWADGLVAALDEHDWRLVTLPPRHFAWRVRGSAMSLLCEKFDTAFSPSPDAVVATSMLDVAGARAWLPGLDSVPLLAYFHENQFAYPSDDPHIEDVRLIGLRNALAADRVAFNSAWNRDSFFAGAERLLAQMPDAVPADMLSRVRARTEVLPVPLAHDAVIAGRRRIQDRTRPLRLLWNHRWEYDKGPERLLHALELLDEASSSPLPEWELVLCGQQFRRRPPALETLLDRFASRIVHAGFIPQRAAYLDLLASCDVVISTALHDFQGLAVMEAVTAGCVPVVPDRLAYPEWFAPRYRYTSHERDVAAEARALAAKLVSVMRDHAQHRAWPVPALAHATWPALVDRYRRAIDNTRNTRDQAETRKP